MFDSHNCEGLCYEYLKRIGIINLFDTFNEIYKMKLFLVSLFFILSIFIAKGQSIIDRYKNNFRGIELSGYFNNKFKTIESGADFRWTNWAEFISVKYSSDNLYSIYGLNTSLQKLFPISKFFPLIQFSNSLNHAKSKSTIALKNSIINEISLSLGAGLIFELSKHFQFSGSLNYEMVGVFRQRVYFNLRPLINLIYEF